jgi:hypothetical protein
MKVIGAAKSVDGAYERVQEQILSMRVGGYLLPISTEAQIQVYLDEKKLKCSFEDARTLLAGKPADVRKKIRDIIYKSHSKAASKFDSADHGGKKFVTVRNIASKIIFTFTDRQIVIFDLTEMLKLRAFKKLYEKLATKGREQLNKKFDPENLTEFEMARVVSEKFSEITLWENKLVLQEIEKLSQNDITFLFANLMLLRKRIIETEESKKPHDSITLNDVSLAIQTVIVNLDEHYQKVN